MAAHNLAVILKNPQNDTEFLLTEQTPPAKFGEEEYDSYVDSDLWDLPSTQLNSLEAESESGIVFEAVELCPPKINLKKFDFELALNRVLGHAGLGAGDAGEWRFWKYVEEPEFGPGLPLNTIFIMGKLVSADQNLPEQCKWMSIWSCQTLLLDVKPNNSRIGLLVVVGLISDSMQSTTWKVPSTLQYQEYPPGVVLVPLHSRTAKPFHTTNLIIFARENVSDECEGSGFVTCGDALIVDPGCHPQSSGELKKIISALPRKLVVFVTHHHGDHVDGLSIIQKCNPDATLLAHENTMRRIGKDDWSLGYTSVSGSEQICIGGQTLRVIFAPGHTDGHVGLLHVKTHSLIVGDHCVGNRRSREASILKAIENGAQTLFEIVADVYSNVDRSFWIPAASNVRLHMDHLAQQDKLPKEFSILRFQRSSGLYFLSRWLCSYIWSRLSSRNQKSGTAKLFIAGAVAGCFAVTCRVLR
ncbi:uncharacterized protein LOC120012485 isoform X4 [Tripterygium wilfordii]|uniref:uncharacterized protein LOC120012485 isoform X4 n=1 Tax=Tripterygium wilfordii TaxID=458696 RepID=UPI0018F81648|nr:uncharacterized protein LOC120012485 isoform X4 [Tripterygium wilfordii]